MHDDELQELAQQWAERTAVEQGLPPRIEDVAVLRHVLYLMGFLDLEGRQRAAHRVEARLELPTVSKLLKLLGHAGLVESFRGVNGGYRLARPAEAISLADIIEAMEGPIGMTECSVAQGHCDRQSQCGVSDSWRSVSGAIGGVLRGMTLAQMLAGRPTAPVKDATR